MSHTVNAPDWSTIPAPFDDGGTDHLPGKRMTDIDLQATDGQTINLLKLPGRVVVFAYPRTGRPDRQNPDGWDMIPGARGCTPQSCGFRDHFTQLKELGINRMFGLSTQDSDYQREAAVRLNLPFPLLSDHDLKLTCAMQFPTFETAGMTLLKRFTIVIENGVIEHVVYPVFPPDRDAANLVDWLSKRRSK